MVGTSCHYMVDICYIIPLVYIHITEQHCDVLWLKVPLPPSLHRFFFGVLTYLAVGAAYQYFVVGARGLQIIPHYNFWSTVPVLIVVSEQSLSKGGLIIIDFSDN